LEKETARLRRQLKETKRSLLIVGAAPAMKAVRALIRRVAPTDSTVLIVGETGTGKELVSRTIHELSPRASGPFIVVDCATLVGALFESELFGHAKGSFTGAVATTHGRVELADGGTLFLDEISCIEPGIQAKLLRVLEEREFRRVGSNQTISVNVRVIAATNMDLAEEVAKGAFREDLYYRLCVVPIVLPPLRERKSDIPALAEHLLRLQSQQRNKHVTRISKAAMAALAAQHWPGNVRELSNAIERAVVLADGDEILPEHLLHYRAAYSSAVAAPAKRFPTLRDVEQEHVARALREAGGNKALAAKFLGIDRKTLWRRLKGRTASEGSRGE
jgi:DNA-binding NtrC family response regulator